MARIQGKLNLNRTPELVDSNSLIFAKNVRWFANSFRADYGFADLNLALNGYSIVGIIPHNVCFYILLYNTTSGASAIKCYNENTKELSDIPCNWNYNGTSSFETTITGYCTTTLYGEVVLTIAEHYKGIPTRLIPLKHIVVGTIDNAGNTISNYNDNESIYTQAPEVPLINLKLLETYSNPIPAGTYQFFIRYEIRKNHYTNWFPASKELFTGTTRTMLTNQGKIHYLDDNVDSNESFVLRVEKIKEVSGFKSFQLGFIIAHDNEVYARAYKHYELGTTDIYFDYDTDYIEEVSVRDMLESVYNLYNVKNVTSYKNKLYVANYIESDFNPDLSGYAKQVQIEIKKDTNVNIQTFAGYAYNSEFAHDTSYIESLTINDLAGESVKTIPEIIALLVASSDTNNWIRQIGSGHRNLSLYGIRAEITKYTEEDPIDSGADTIDPEYEPITPDTLDKRYYLTSAGGFSEDDLELQVLLDAIADDIVGIRISDGKIMNDRWLANASYVITYYSITPPRHGLQYKKETNVTIQFSINPADINAEYKLTSTYSLVPHQKYAFYLHFVRANGEITNGSKIPESNFTGDYLYEDGTIKESIDGVTADAIYPAFSFNFEIPKEYAACFISLVHTDYNVAEIFDIQQMWSDIEKQDSQEHMVGDCLELDTALYPALQNIPVIFKSTVTDENTQEETTTEINTTVDYRSSYDSEFLATFGSSGKCVFAQQFDDNDEPEAYTIGKEKYAFIQMPYSANEKYIQLTRCTPFISWEGNTGTYDDYGSLNLLGYVCRVCKPLPNYDNYFSGSDIYSVDRQWDPVTKSYKITLSPKEESADIWYTYRDSPFFTIYSNFNLNYVSLRELVIKNIVSKKPNSSNGEEENQENSSSDTNYNTYLLLNFQSLNLSDVYELKPMYRSYTRRNYFPYTDDKNVTTFDNTIRSSDLQGDEEHINTFRFRPTDYYNVPTNKGKIVNVVAIADYILVHTEDSIFRFSGTNSIIAAGGEDIQLKENEPFDSGIQELFGSEFGYAGLQNKAYQTLSEIGYTFFDSDARRLYLYGDQNQMKVLSDDIENLFKHAKIKDVAFADDYYNNRVFICLTFDEGNNVETHATLSYDFAARSFISMHDFIFDWSFKTKTKCYFIHNRSSIYVVDTQIGNYGSLEFNDNLYPSTQNKDCIVDVIFNTNFETIKVLNAIEWVCNEIDTTIQPVADLLGQYVAEEKYQIDNPEIRYKGDKLLIYTDSCATEIIDISERSNDFSLQNVNSFKQVRYNLGKWTYNYFRNILNRSENPISPRTLGQDDTLIYGKYFVVRFVFDRYTNFKFEDVTFNYGQVQ